MAEQYDNSNSFVLFKNDKGDNEKRPDYTGTITLEGGKEMNLSAWVRESKAGVAFLSGRVNEKNVNQAPSEPRKREAVAEDVPF
tara:strand:+ start:286 stop:537 length:252 start_codon:yes stop_codon:yes gene_type:complete